MLKLTNGLKYLRNFNKFSSTSNLIINNDKKFYSNYEDEKRNPIVSKGVKLFGFKKLIFIIYSFY
jgi:hypothetical protein